MKRIGAVDTKNYISVSFMTEDQNFCGEGILSPSGILCNCNVTNKQGDKIKTFSVTHYGDMIKETKKVIKQHLENKL